MTRPKGTEVCFKSSGVAGTVYIVDRINLGRKKLTNKFDQAIESISNLGFAFPPSRMVNLVVTKGGISPLSLVSITPLRLI